MKNVIGIDLGGTTIVGGRIENDTIVKKVSLPTQAEIGGETTLQVLLDVITQLINPETTGIGVGVPSVVDREKGIVYNVQNIKGWEEIHLKAHLEETFNLPVTIDNDANCFAIGERIFGKGKAFQHFVGITLGTGVGGGIIQAGSLLGDANCGSGEFGELPYLDSIVEEYCGSRFFPREAEISGYEASVRAAEGDQAALQLFETYGKHLAAMVKMIMLVVDPQAIIFGGSIARSFPLFEKSLRDHLNDFPYPNSVKKLILLASDLQESGVLGAGALSINKQNKI